MVIKTLDIFLLQKVMSKYRKKALKKLKQEGFISESGLSLDEALDNDIRNKKRDNIKR